MLVQINDEQTEARNKANEFRRVQINVQKIIHLSVFLFKRAHLENLIDDNAIQLFFGLEAI
jgi:hypothetical protein